MLLNSSTSNLLHEYLNAVGIPWELSRASLAAKYGIKVHPAYSWEVIEITTHRPFLDGMIWPLSVQVFSNFSPHMPATEFSGVAYHCDNAQENFARSVDELKLQFGEGKATGNSNTLGYKWTFGPGSVELIAWPPEMQRWPSSNPSHEREPRLKTGCYFQVQTGFRPKASANEAALLAAFVPIARILKEKTPASKANVLPAAQNELEYIRQPDEHHDHCYGWIGTSSDRSALIWFSKELYIVPMDEIIKFEVARTKPARGRGGSWMKVQCRCNYPGQATKLLEICAARGPNELNEFAQSIADATGKPLALLPYDYDE